MIRSTAKRVLKPAVLAAARLRAQFDAADVSIFHEFVPPPFGGGNQFMQALWNELAQRGWRLENNTVSPVTRACVFNSFNFDADRLRGFKRPSCRMVHRVDGPIALYRGTTDAIDRGIADVNAALADATVFQSHYSRTEHERMGLTFRSPVVIPNASDPAIFHARGRVPFSRERRTRMIATSWSDNPNKGGAVLAWLDQHLDHSRYELTFLGRTQAAFTRARVLPPVPSQGVADLLRQHDIYIAASLHEPCSNALVEALSCGLPALYVASGSHGELVGEAGLAFTAREEAPAQLDRLVAEYEMRQSRINAPRLAEVVDRYLAVMGLPERPAA